VVTGNELVQFFAQWGFPAALVMFLLLRFERAIDRLARQIELNTVILAKMAGMDLDEERRRFRANNNTH